MHFDVTAAPASMATAYLDIPMHCLDMEDPAGEMDLWVFPGDGTCSLDEYTGGSLRHTFVNITGEFPTLSIDLTALVQTYMLAGHGHLGIRLMAPYGGDRYDVGEDGGVPAPTLTCSP